MVNNTTTDTSTHKRSYIQKRKSDDREAEFSVLKSYIKSTDVHDDKDCWIGLRLGYTGYTSHDSDPSISMGVGTMYGMLSVCTL